MLFHRVVDGLVRWIPTAAAFCLLAAGLARPTHAQTIYTVDTTADEADDGECALDCTLREAIALANGDAAMDSIRFSVAGTITLASALPTITDSVTIDGTTATGYAAGTPTLEIRGATKTFVGLDVTGQGSRVVGLIVRNFTVGIHVRGTGRNTFLGNFIGSNPADDNSLGNTDGVIMESSSNLLGDTGTANRNIISANTQHGVIAKSGSIDNDVIGNYIGTNAAGSAALGNAGTGVRVEGTGTQALIGWIESGNVISGNATGIHFMAVGNNNVARDNLIGTDWLGQTAVPNTTVGVDVESGGVITVFNNVISGNTSHGIWIHGASARGAVQSNIIGANSDGTVALGNGGHGVFVDNAGTGTGIGGATFAGGIGNLISGNTMSGIRLEGASSANTVVESNHIGTDLDGFEAMGNGVAGLHIVGAVSSRVGRESHANVISGNTDGVVIEGAATNTVLQSNLIGTSVSGLADVGNTRYGIHVKSGAAALTIGGAGDGLGNTVAGNDTHGIFIEGDGHFLHGNNIGTGANGTALVGNTGDGVRIAASSNTVGGPSDLHSNSITGNEGNGITVLSGTGNLIRRNEIAFNTGIGIDLGGDGVTANDNNPGGAPDTDAGANNLINFPDFTGAYVGSTVLSGTLRSVTGDYILEFFHNLECNASNHGGGDNFVRLEPVTVDGIGDGSFNFADAAALGVGDAITATATGPDSSTSEFSRCITVADYKVELNTAAQNHQQGATDTLLVTVSAVGGTFPVAVDLSCTGLPAGATCSFVSDNMAPGDTSWTTKFALQTNTSTPGGPFTLTVAGTAGAVVRQGTATVNVLGAAVATYNLGATPTTPVTVTMGGAAHYEVTATAVGAFATPVNLTCLSGLPAGATCEFLPAQLTPDSDGEKTTLSIKTTASTPNGFAAVSVEGDAGGTKSTAVVGLNVTATPSFTVAADPVSGATRRGGTATYTVTVTPTGGGFGEDVTLACIGELQGAGCTFNPASVSPTSSAQMSTLTVTTDVAITPPGKVGFGIVGSAPSGTQGGVLAQIVVTDFSVAVNPSAASVKGGTAATYTVTVSPNTSGVSFGEAVALTCGTGVPTGSACSFDPASVTPNSANATSTLTVTTAAISAAVSGTTRYAGTGLSLRQAIALALLSLIVSLLFLVRPRDRRHRTVFSRWRVAVAVMAIVLVGPACGSDSPTTPTPTPTPPPVNGTFDVTGTAGTLVRSTPVTITINP